MPIINSLGHNLEGEKKAPFQVPHRVKVGAGVEMNADIEAVGKSPLSTVFDCFLLDRDWSLGRQIVWSMRRTGMWADSLRYLQER